MWREFPPTVSAFEEHINVRSTVIQSKAAGFGNALTVAIHRALFLSTASMRGENLQRR
jgi:hypothetical protein